MSVQKYTYTKKVNIETLCHEIHDCQEIIVASSHINTNGDNVDIYMKDNLSVEESIALTNVVAAHDSTVTIAEAPLVVKVQEELNVGFTSGSFQSSSFPIDIGAEVGWHYAEHTFPMNISLISCDLLIAPEHVGNILEVIVAPNTIIGNITADVTEGDTEIQVSPTVIENIYVGYFFSITENPNDDQYRANLGRVLEVKNASIIVEIGAPRAYAMNTPTYAEMSIKVFHNWEFPHEGRIDIGDSKIGSSDIPKNTVIKLAYHNKNGGAKRFVLPADYVY